MKQTNKQKKMNWKDFCKAFFKKLWKKIILGTSNAWLMSRSSNRPSDPYILNIVGFLTSWYVKHLVYSYVLIYGRFSLLYLLYCTLHWGLPVYRYAFSFFRISVPVVFIVMIISSTNSYFSVKKHAKGNLNPDHL